MRTLILAAGLLLAATPVVAQEAESDPDASVSEGGEIAAGWEARLDKADASLDEVRFVTMGDGYHATLGPAAIFYRPEDTATGDYRVSATFTQTQASEHPEAYGLFLGGRELDGENQDYLYFLVRQDGKFLVKHRAGAETHTLVDWTDHDAVAATEGDTSATNALAVEVAADSVRFEVNDVEVAALERPAYMNTDGIAGLRINHNLDVHVADFAIDGGDAEAGGS